MALSSAPCEDNSFDRFPKVEPTPTMHQLMNPSHSELFTVKQSVLPADHADFPGATMVTYCNPNTGEKTYEFLVDTGTGNVYLAFTKYLGDGNVAQMIFGSFSGQMEE